MTSETRQGTRIDRLAVRRMIDGNACSIKRTLDIVGDSWSLLILRDAIWGVRRFSDFQSLLGIPRAVLSDRLRKLTEHGILAPRDYRDGNSRVRQEYVLTGKGRELATSLFAIMHWGDTHLGRGPVVLKSARTGEAVSVRFANEHGEIVRDDDVVAELAAAAPPAGNFPDKDLPSSPLG